MGPFSTPHAKYSASTLSGSTVHHTLAKKKALIVMSSKLAIASNKILQQKLSLFVYKVR